MSRCHISIKSSSPTGSTEVIIMSKGMDSKKSDKKKPEKSLKEKRQEKKDKKTTRRD
jgi:hypothetical protein